MSTSLNRRKFLAGSAVMAAALISTGCVPEIEGSEIDDEKWDDMADVVVLGFGAAGGSASFYAAENGASVLVLESTSVPGGTTRISGGTCYFPNNLLQKEHGINDSKEKSTTYLKQISMGQADDELIEAYVDLAPSVALDIQNKTGIEWVLAPYPDYHPEWEGGQRQGRSLNPKYGDKTSGNALMAGIYDACVARGVRFAFNTKAYKLIQDDAGRVVGVIANQANRTVRVKAKKGVIIATGGFEWDETLAKNYLRGPVRAHVTLPGGKGEGLKMAMAVGADLRNMNESWGLPVYLLPGWEEEVASFDAKKYQRSGWKKIIGDWFIYRTKPGTIIVNSDGKRFLNESADYDSAQYGFLGRKTWGDAGWENEKAYIIADKNEWDKWAFAQLPAGSEPPEYVVKADTLEELAKKLGINPEGLKNTVERFNKYASQDVPVDPDFRRGESFFERAIGGDASISSVNPEDPKASLAPLTKAPYYGMPIYSGSCGTAGGPRVNRNAQVIDVFGNVIKGLYAAGNASGVGAPGGSYAGPGGTNGPAIVFGSQAGKTAALDN
jgi:succinate dehydrogenase/fumarate reductase flavoprotein subunit